MKLECPHCGQRLEADDEQAGEIVPCPKCNQDMTLPDLPGMRARAEGSKTRDQRELRAPFQGESTGK